MTQKKELANRNARQSFELKNNGVFVISVGVKEKLRFGQIKKITDVLLQTFGRGSKSFLRRVAVYSRKNHTHSRAIFLAPGSCLHP